MNKELLNCERVWLNVTPATLNDELADYGLLPLHAIGVKDGKIHALVPMAELKGPYPAHWLDMQGKLVTPGLIDCHTHLVFAGSRAEEFELRQQGVPYAEIARRGGGIISTVCATRTASEEQLFELALPRVTSLIREGVTTVEIKSGYGLTLDDELKMLRVARRLGEALPIRVKTTLLAAHAVPPEYRDDPDSWVETICQEIIPAAAEAGLADAVDVFCEHIGFSLAQTEQVYLAADQYGLPVKGHMDQLSNLGGSTLAAHFGASRWIIWSIWIRKGSWRWPTVAWSPPCCPPPSTSSKRPSCRRLPPCVRRGWRWRSPPTSTRVPPPSSRCGWR